MNHENQPVDLKALCTVLVASCDKYKDVLVLFTELWKKHWADCPFDCVLVTETDPDACGIFSRVITCGNRLSWCEMMAQALEQIETPYLMLLMDDYFLTEKVDTVHILSRFEQMQKFNAANLRLIPNPMPQLPFAADSSLGEYDKRKAYCVATQTGFWQRDYLQSLVKGLKSAWEFERYGSFRVSGETRPILATRQKEFPFVDAVHKGYWEPFGIAVCEEHGLTINFTIRPRPPLKVRLIEGLKALIFKTISPTLIVKIQNRFGLGMKEKPKA